MYGGEVGRMSGILTDLWRGAALPHHTARPPHQKKIPPFFAKLRYGTLQPQQPRPWPQPYALI